MNLCFKTKIGNHFIEFPYQTSTNTTYDVLNLKTTEERLDYLYKDIDRFNGGSRLKQDVKEILYNDTLELSLI
jgi:hypothetical protein